MRSLHLLLLIPLLTLIACDPQPAPPPPTKAFILAGSSFVSNDEAVGEAQLAIRNAQANGCRALSIGGGAGVEVITVNVLVECPENGPDLLATGIATP